MTYDLYLGDRTYSSWSLRGWLLVERFDLPARTHFVTFSGEQTVAEQLSEIGNARTVPTLVTPEGAVISESLALAEELASRHPDAGLWPADPLGRAVARTLASEMHAGFGPLREYCPMNLGTSYTGVPVPDNVAADLRRLELIWSEARSQTNPDGPWLAGDYSIADAFYAPVAARIAGYGLEVSAEAKAYVSAHLSDPAFRRWRAMGLAGDPELPWYRRDYEKAPWPGPKPLPAHAIDEGSPENDVCPYSGKEITHLGAFDGRIFGFCNAFCRDKTVHDAKAWPAFMAVYET